MHKLVIGTLLIAVVQGLSACAVETLAAEEDLAADAAPSGDDVAGSEGEPDEPVTDEPVADEADSGEDQIVEKGRCGQTFKPFVTGGRAEWALNCSGGVITIRGWVQDLEADGECARVRVELPNGDVRHSNRACPAGEYQDFKFSARGSVIYAYLQVVK